MNMDRGRGVRAVALIAALATAVSCGTPLAKTTAGHPTATSQNPSPSPAAPPAIPKMDGSYNVVAGPAGTPSVTWVFTPCGDGCADVEIGGQGASQRATARYVGVAWTIDLHSATALQCGDGSHVPGTAHYSWNPDTLEGRYWSTADGGQPCGYSQSLDTYPVPLKLTKAGS